MNAPNAGESYTSQGPELCYVNFTSITRSSCRVWSRTGSLALQRQAPETAVWEHASEPTEEVGSREGSGTERGRPTGQASSHLWLDLGMDRLLRLGGRQQTG